MGDFNSDEILDLAVANLWDNDVSILIGKGDGGFKYHQDYPVDRGPTGIVVADFDMDKIPDLAVTNSFDGTVCVLLGEGDGGFASPQSYKVGNRPYNLVAGDFNSKGENYPLFLKITKPENALYLRNRKILRLFKPLIIGKIDIEVEATQEQFGIHRVEFYIDNELKEIDTTKSFSWTWDEKVFLKHRYTIKVVAFDNLGNSTNTEIIVRKFF